jgi:hypothetical protein
MRANSFIDYRCNPILDKDLCLYSKACHIFHNTFAILCPCIGHFRHLWFLFFHTYVLSGAPYTHREYKLLLVHKNLVQYIPIRQIYDGLFASPDDHRVCKSLPDHTSRTLHIPTHQTDADLFDSVCNHREYRPLLAHKNRVQYIPTR